MDLLTSFNLYPLFNEPSRVTVRSRTCIDNIFTNYNISGISTKTENMHISDHMTQLVTVSNNFEESETNKNDTIKVRDINDYNLYLFKEKIASQPWQGLLEGTAQESFNVFHETFMYWFNAYFPERNKKVTKNNINSKNFVINDKQTQAKRNTLDALCTIAIANKDAETYSIYRDYKKNYIEHVNNMKKTANTEYIQSANNRQKAIWTVINAETEHRNKRSRELTPLSADVLNDYFLNLKTPIDDDDRQDAAAFLKVLNLNTEKSFYLEETNEGEVMSVIQHLENKQTKDIYGITTNFLQKVKNEIALPLTTVVNKCFEEGVFPAQLKMAKVIPIYKKGKKDDCSNYRPIAILPAISKILEKVVVSRLTTYFEQKAYLTDKQHGYRKKRSTSTGILEVLEAIMEAFDNREQVELTCCDLSKAFDMVKYDILLDKLYYYGIRGLQHKLLSSYLSERYQMVELQHETSVTKPVLQGVPQGSILGPLLFIIYTNDLPNNITNARPSLYADDTAFLTTGRTAEEIRLKTEVVLVDIQQWFQANGLTLNNDKTQHLRFAAKNDPTPLNSVRYLGLTLDSKLSWKAHTEELARRLATSVYTIRTMKSIATHEAAKTAYYANFESRLTYGVLFWAMSPAAERMFLLQKGAVRALCDLEKRESCRPYFKRERVLTLPCIYILSCLKYVLNNPERFKLNGDTHHYGTRNRDDLQTPYHRLRASQGCIDYWGPKIYNKFKFLKPLNVRRAKQVLLDCGFYSIEEFLNNDFQKLC